MTRRNASGDLQRIDVIRNQFDVLDAIDLRNQDAVESKTDNCGEVVELQAASERIDADQERPVAWRTAQQVLHHVARQRLARRRDGIFQIENQRVGADAGCFRELALAVGWYKQKGA